LSLSGGRHLTAVRRETRIVLKSPEGVEQDRRRQRIARYFEWGQVPTGDHQDQNYQRREAQKRARAVTMRSKWNLLKGRRN
jgi:hypothetical protein